MVNTSGSDPSDRPGPEKYKLGLFGEMEKAHAAFEQQAKEAWQAAVDPDYLEELTADVEGTRPIGIEFHERLTAVDIEEADTAKYSFLFSAKQLGGGEEPFTQLGMRLYRHNSPFIFETDLDKYGNDAYETYTVVAAAEYPPFIVNPKEFEIHPSTISEYIKRLKQSGETPRFLSDEACKSIMDGLREQTVNVEMTATESLSSAAVDHFDFKK